MDRIESLIEQLKNQYARKADPGQLLGTLQLLQFEISSRQTSAAQTLGTSKISVILPLQHSVKQDPVTLQHTDPALEKYAPKPASQPTREVKEIYVLEPDEDTMAQLQKNGQLDMVFDPLQDIPTLSSQPPVTAREINTHKEVNESTGSGESLNDKLKQGKTELMEVLRESPVKDLRKAIGINDRFVFINELFKGDEVAFDRSVKTINAFHIYAEAEFWISRELKTKYGWNPDHAAVLQFDQLVKRRFS